MLIKLRSKLVLVLSEVALKSQYSHSLMSHKWTVISEISSSLWPLNWNNSDRWFGTLCKGDVIAAVCENNWQLMFKVLPAYTHFRCKSVAHSYQHNGYRQMSWNLKKKTMTWVLNTDFKMLLFLGFYVNFILHSLHSCTNKSFNSLYP